MKNLIKKILREDKDWDWAKDIKPLSMDGDYVLDVGDMGRQDYSILVDDLKDLGYDTTILPDSPYGIVRLRYIYLEYNEENGEYSTDWNDYQNQNPTYGGRYRMLTMEDFTELFYYWKMEKQVPFVMDRHLKEDKDWDFMGDINPIHEDGKYVIVVEGELSASDWEKMLDYMTHLGYNPINFLTNGDGHWGYDDLYIINDEILAGDGDEGVIFYLSKNYKGLKRIDWNNIKHLEEAKENGYIPIMLDDFNEMGENHLKSLKEDKDWDFMDDVEPIHNSYEYVIVMDRVLDPSDWEKFVDYTITLGYNMNHRGDAVDWLYRDLDLVNKSVKSDEGVIFYLEKDHKGNKRLGWDNIDRLDDAIKEGKIPIMLDDFNEIGIENHLKTLKEDKDWDFMDVDNITIIEALESILEGTQFSVVVGEYENDEGDMEDIIRLKDGNVTLSSLPYQNYDIKMENVDKLLEFIITHLESRVSIENNITGFGIPHTSKQLGVVIGLIKDYMGNAGE